MQQTDEVKEIPIQATMLKPTFRTFGSGRLGVMIRIQGETPEDQQKLVDHRMIAILIDSVREYYERRLFPLSTHWIRLNTETGNTVFGSVVTESPEIKKPTHCLHCGRPLFLKSNDGEIWCQNLKCPAHSLACVRQLVEGRLNHGLQNHLESFLENYLCPDPTPINNMFEFHQMFLARNNYDKRNTLRKSQWINTFGDMGALYWRIELAFQAVLQRKQIPALEFWDCCAFPFTPPGFESQVPNDFRIQTESGFKYLDPSKLLAVHSEIKPWLTPMSDRSRRLLADNLGFVKLLHSVYTHHGDVEWI